MITLFFFFVVFISDCMLMLLDPVPFHSFISLLSLLHYLLTLSTSFFLLFFFITSLHSLLHTSLLSLKFLCSSSFIILLSLLHFFTLSFSFLTLILLSFLICSLSLLHFFTLSPLLLAHTFPSLGVNIFPFSLIMILCSFSPILLLLPHHHLYLCLSSSYARLFSPP